MIKLNQQLKFISLLVVAILVCVLLSYLNIFNYLIGIVELIYFIPLSLILVFLFEPIIEIIPFKSRVLCCSIVYFSILIVILSLVILFIPTLINESIEILNSSFFQNNQFIQDIIEIGDESNVGMQVAVESTLGVISSFEQVALSYIGAYFISLDLHSIVQVTKKHFPVVLRFKNFYLTCNNVMYFYIKSLSIDLTVLFIGVFSFLWLMDFEHPLEFAVLLSFFNLIPYVGATIGQLLIVAVDAVSYDELRIMLLIGLFAIQQIEANFLQPYIFKKILNVKPIITLLSFLIFGYLFGIAGYVLAPVLAVVTQLAYHSYMYTNQIKTVGTWEKMWYNFEEINDEDK